jgi:threonine dehydrogenase-like Zn-dependent dehydrogenase
MRAIAVHPRTREVSVIEQAEPRLESPTQAKIRILDVGVCGTDREICAFEYGTPPGGAEHLVLGHEALGEVIEVGPSVRGFAPGDLVVPMVRRPCGVEECGPCADGRQDFCTTGRYRERGINQAHGFMTELIVDDARWLVRVPPSLREVAVLVEPLTIAEKALAQVRLIQMRLPWRGRRRALVLGAGPVGLLAAMALVEEGLETTVFAREPAPNPRAAVVEAIGGRYASGRETPLAEVARQMGSVDLIFEATGVSSVSFEALAQLGANGVFVMTGVPGRRGPQAIDTDGLMRALVLRNQVLLGTVNAGRVDFESAIADLERFSRRWPSAVRALISGRHSIEGAARLLQTAPAGIKEVISFGSSFSLDGNHRP